MADLLTTKQLQEILHVDRTTIYRMAESGRVPAVKVGNQWRFPREQIETWLQRQSATVAPAAELSMSANGMSWQLFPLECAQLIQDSFADALGVMILATDLNGQAVTSTSNPCGLYTVAESSPMARQRCLDTWIRLANEPALAPRFQASHLGLLCARGLIRVGSEIKGMLIVGGIAPQAWPPSDDQIEQIAQDLALHADQLRQHIHAVHHLDAAEQTRVLPFVQRIADIFSHIASERAHLAGRLQRIAEISRL
jgi:excisionase family DNA binding protein